MPSIAIHLVNLHLQNSSSKLLPSQNAFMFYCTSIVCGLKCKIKNKGHGPLFYFFVLVLIIALAISNSYKMEVRYSLTSLSFGFRLTFFEPNQYNA